MDDFRTSLGSAAVAAALIVIGLPLASPVEAAALHRVPQDFARVTDALAAAAAGDTIEVGPGTYSAASNGEAFPLAIATADLTLRGAGMGGSVLDANDAASVVRITATGARLLGFTITGGRADLGGGVYLETGSGSPEIAHCLLLENGAATQGSGIYVNVSLTPWIHHNVVWESYDTSVPSGGDPHGIQLAAANGIIEHNLLGRGDSNALFNGGTASEPIVRHNIFLENGLPSPLRGRGFCALGGPGTAIIHNLFFGNVVAAVLQRVNGTPTDMSGTQANGLSPTDAVYGNIDVAPMLSDPDVLDFSLKPGSPAIDAGDPAAPLDPDGTVADIGPFFFDQRLVDVGNGKRGPALSLVAAPNPAPGRTTFRFTLPRAGRVRLALYDGRGALRATIAEGAREAGDHTVSWDSNSGGSGRLAGGLYFARLELDGARVTEKLLLVRRAR
ncbi:MAG: DUF1565 domain-containing protein [Candidatus Eiseniibacteriota bacterium]